MAWKVAFLQSPMTLCTCSSASFVDPFARSCKHRWCTQVRAFAGPQLHRQVPCSRFRQLVPATLNIHDAATKLIQPGPNPAHHNQQSHLLHLSAHTPQCLTQEPLKQREVAHLITQLHSTSSECQAPHPFGQLAANMIVKTSGAGLPDIGSALSGTHVPSQAHVRLI